MSARGFTIWVFAAAAAVWLLMFSGVPLGVPGEWTWPRHPAGVFAVVGLAVVAGLYVFAVDGLAQRLGPSRMAGPALIAAGFAMTVAALHAVDSAAPAAGASRSPWVLYLSGTSGYFREAFESDQSAGQFLRGYEATVAEGEYLHQGTHPPGLILAYRVLTAAVRAAPPLQSVAAGLSSTAWRDSVSVLFETSGRPADPVAAATLWWASTLTVLAHAAAAWPLWLLLRRVLDDTTAWRVAALWPLVPAGFVFLPKSDCLFPVLGLSVAVLWLRGCDGRGGAALAAGLVACGALLLSLAPGPVFAAVAVGTVVHAAVRKETRRLWRPAAFGSAGFLLPLIGFGAAGLNVPAVWIQNLRNHAAFYDHFPRTYAAWLPVNLLEGVVAASLPVVVACLGRREVRRRSRVDFVAWSVVAAWLLLWLSGKNMGEAARLWVMLTPWPLVLLGLRGGVGRGHWRVLAAAAAVAFVAVATRVDGFNLAAAGS